jgi:hypothetical protein
MNHQDEDLPFPPIHPQGHRGLWQIVRTDFDADGNQTILEAKLVSVSFNGADLIPCVQAIDAGHIHLVNETPQLELGGRSVAWFERWLREQHRA